MAGLKKLLYEREALPGVFPAKPPGFAPMGQKNRPYPKKTEKTGCEYGRY